MKKLILSSAILIIGIYSVNAQGTSKENEVNAPEITFEKVVHDYGTIYKGSDGTSYFPFKNTGKEPLILSQPKSSCGCTVPTWPKKPILPGKEDKIKVTYNTRRMGRIYKTVKIYSNAKNSPILLTIKGKVVEKPKEEIPEKKLDEDSSPVNK